ncbi:MAG TPA: DNA repair and recombination protein RadA [Candidatus Bathyarchaeia archaeon]|nr:DNA repair and recombination protein RadA [Candidatus Bathyarchaeia archaeon]
MSEGYTTLDKMEGLSSQTLSKLREAGYVTVESIAVAPSRELEARTGLSEDTVVKVVKAARDLCAIEFMSADQLYERKKSALRLTTGSKNLDSIIGGGVETQTILEIIGEFGSGKSQICLTLSALCQLPRDKGGIEGNVLFVDTEGTFYPQRVYQIAQANGLDPEKTLSNITYARAHNSDHQILIVEKCPKMILKNNIKLIIVDSIISHFRGEYMGRENLSERQQKLNLHIHDLLRTAETYNLAVVVTNQVQSNPAAFFGDPNRPAGGNILAHASTYRLYLRKSKASNRKAILIDNPYLPEAEAMFQINEKGVTDIIETET